ncbi:MAG TPA: asparagine synthase (glutamine-hydrolyzing) [Vicinamibacterales bacterium]|nr:asparagine synthase (glutamine-hydrolyzing) [Vicinamibacterales bacterium]
MCGIVAAVSRRGGLSEQPMERATRRLHHRGPDAQRVWVSPDGVAALGHARLSIIDLETGDQPIANEDSRLRIIVNGEFYDFERTRDALVAAGHAFRTRSDSEIALHLYEDRGAHAVHALRGEFAFALWDERDRVLFAARDRFGIKPLYYTVHDGACYLASEVKAFPDLGVPLGWDRETLYDTHSMFMAHAPERTLFAGVYQLPPGHFLFTDGEHVRVEEYWDWDFPLADDDADEGDEREWIERLREALGEAIRLRLRADVPVACYLSGGIDSSAVLGFASKCSPRPLRAYTLSFDHADYDEAPIAEETAALAGAEFCRIDVRPDQLVDHFGDAVYHAERPIGNAHSVAKFMLSRAVRDSGIKVVLTGEGGDEMFAGYPEVRQDLESFRAGGAGGAGQRQPFPSLEGVQRLLGYVPTNAKVWANFGAGLMRVLRRDFLGEFPGRDAFRILFNSLDVERRMSGRHPVNQSLYLFGKTMLPNYILSNLGDRMEMAHSIEGRLPLLDHRVAELAARMPVSMKIRGTIEKDVLREAARPVLTQTVYTRTKHTFVSPPSTLQPGGSLFAFLQDTLRSSAIDGPGIYDRAKLVPMLDALPTMEPQWRTYADPLIVWIASLCILGERFRL